LQKTLLTLCFGCLFTDMKKSIEKQGKYDKLSIQYFYFTSCSYLLRVFNPLIYGYGKKSN